MGRPWWLNLSRENHLIMGKPGRPKGSKNKPKPPVELRSITDELFDKLMLACNHYSYSEKKNERWKLYLTILWRTGIRPSEALAITTDDIFTDKIRVTRLKRRGKEKKNVDYVPILESLYNQIVNYVSQYKVRGKLFPVTYDGAVYAFSKLKQMAGLSYEFTLHGFRHGYAYKYLRCSVSERDALARLQRALGHKSLDSTSKYTIPTFDSVHEDTRRMYGDA